MRGGGSEGSEGRGGRGVLLFRFSSERAPFFTAWLHNGAHKHEERYNDDRMNVSGQMSLSLPPSLPLLVKAMCRAALWTNKTTAVSSTEGVGCLDVEEEGGFERGAFSGFSNR